MRATEIISCYIGPQISPEAFVAQHFFLYLGKGAITGYEGHRKYNLRPREYCIVRKNSLVKYNKQKDAGSFEKVVVVFDEDFLKPFQQRHRTAETQAAAKGAFVALKDDKLVH